MQYMLMCCIDESRWLALPDGERDAIMRDYGAWVADLERAGQHRREREAGREPGREDAEVQGGRRIVTDGPFAETKEQFGGFHLVECRDLDEALALAERIPTLRVGGAIEVRAVEPRI